MKVDFQNNINLSNTIIKVFRKKNNNLSFHLKTNLIIPTNVTFNTSYIKEVKGYLKLPSSRRIKFSKVRLGADLNYDFNGKFMVVDFYFYAEEKLEDIDNTPVDLVFSFGYDFIGGGVINYDEIKTTGLLKRMFKEY